MSKTKRVRIRVMVWPDGYWTAVGDDKVDADDLELWLCDQAIGGDHDPAIAATVWIEAEIPVPEAPPEATVQGEVVDGGSV